MKLTPSVLLTSMLTACLVFGPSRLSFAQSPGSETRSSTDSTANGDTTGVDGTNIRESGGNQIPIGKSGKGTASNNLIKGHCIMVRSSENPIGGACVNVALVLFDDSGKSIGELRTDVKGNFEVNVDDAQAKYHFGPSSNSYEVEGTNKPTQAGGRVLLRLKLKKL